MGVRQQNILKYDLLFSQLPRGLLEQDYSHCKRLVDRLRSQGVVDLQKFMLNNLETLREVVGTRQLSHVNETLLKMYAAKSESEFIEVEANIDSWWLPDQAHRPETNCQDCQTTLNYASTTSNW